MMRALRLSSSTPARSALSKTLIECWYITTASFRLQQRVSIIEHDESWLGPESQTDVDFGWESLTCEIHKESRPPASGSGNLLSEYQSPPPQLPCCKCVSTRCPDNHRLPDFHVVQGKSVLMCMDAASHIPGACFLRHFSRHCIHVCSLQTDTSDH